MQIKQDINSIISSNRYMIIAIFFVVLHILPYFIYGEDIYVTELDNLDQPPLSIITLLKNSGAFWFAPSSEPVPSIMNGIPRGMLLSELKMDSIIYYYFKPFTAYVTIVTISKMVALLSAFLFLGLFLDRHKYAFVIASAATYFALLPQRPGGFLIVSMSPLVLYALWNIGTNKSIWFDWVVLSVYPLCSILITLPIYIMMIASVWLFYCLWSSRCLNYQLIYALAWMSILYVTSEYRLFESTLFSTVTSHRAEATYFFWPLSECVLWMNMYFWKGHDHACSLHFPFVFVAIILSWFALWKTTKSASSQQCGKDDEQLIGNKLFDNEVIRSLRIQITGIGVALILAIFSGLAFYWLIKDTLKALPVVNMINWERLDWLRPLVWMVVFASTLGILWKCGKGYRAIAIIIVVIQIVFVMLNAEYTRLPNSLAWIKSFRPQWGTQNKSFRRYFAEDQMTDIKDFIGESPSQYRVAALGISPSVLSFNEFYTLDGYNYNYPLEHKHQFRRIIASELNKSDDIRENYDNWGNRCYLFANELSNNSRVSYNKMKYVAKPIATPDYNFTAFKQMGGKYILSAVNLIDADKKGLEYIIVFRSNNSLWDVYLYRVK